MKTVGHFLDPGKFTIVPHVAIVDEFEMVDDDGTFRATIDRDWISKCVAHMNEREATTGDLCPGVIGHTIAHAPETVQPPVTAFLRNWVQGDFFDTGKTAAFADVWVYNEDVDRVRKYPRRSGEVWVNKHEIDPLSFLGASTPARDLGMMKLERGGDIVIQRECPQMPDDKKPDDKPKATDNEQSGMKELNAKLDQLLALLGPLAESMKGGAAPGGEPAPSSTEGDMSDAELEKLLAEAEGGQGGPPQGEPDDKDKSRKAEPEPVQNSGYGHPGGDNTQIKLSRDEWAAHEKKVRDLENLVIESQVKTELVKLARLGYLVDPDDTGLVSDLIAMPPEMRKRQIERLKLGRKDNSRGSFNVDAALASSTDGEPRRMSGDERLKLQKKAIDEKRSFESVAREAGFQL